MPTNAASGIRGTCAGVPQIPEVSTAPWLSDFGRQGPNTLTQPFGQEASPAPTGTKSEPLSPAIECASLPLGRLPSQRRR